ncbi:EthD domain-containing protein [Conexibacter stalactiti]|uniref:EthD domain-containing protein n=1 Tax=Conexibacter stalactiti TaxID=1940611 RepID=A0ABU4HKI4_9ACTN|nr:EthD domain-containing protein [Conexibacter stalactiti]MDW5593060.1 EthD domain-containing protein [Conexibacter stalactiti]MEC5033701.1 EthD domain-containing protein [Conexibacter stalactiti]
MYTLLTVIRKRPEVTTEAFRRFMEFDYGPTYVALPQTRSYVHHYLSDLATDSAEPPIDAIVQISFDSPEAMREALASDSYAKAHELRKGYMLDSSVGVHSAVVDRTLKLV